MNTYFPDDSRIRVLGRTVMQVPLPLFWTGSGVELLADGTELTFVLTADHSLYEEWIRIEVDGSTMIRMPLNQGENRVTVYRGAGAKLKKHVQLFKEVQAMQDDPEAMLLVNAVETDGTLYELPPCDMKIEFIGDSLTSGEGLAGAHHMNDWISCVFSTGMNYTQLTAKALNADIRVISQSGWGCWCSWDHQLSNVLPKYYEQICGLLRGERNEKYGALQAQDFSSWQPDVVFVNLGSNDMTGLKGHPEEGPECFGGAMYGFLRMIRKNNPDALILWACGLGKNVLTETAQKTMDNYRKDTGDTRAELLLLPGAEDFTPPYPDDLMGSRNHPGPLANRYQADVIVKKIREALK